MGTLPVGYRFVGALSIAFALLMGSFVTRIIVDPPDPSFPSNAVDWLLVGVLILAPLPLLLGGALLFSVRPAALRATPWVLGVASVMLLLKAVVVPLAMIQSLKTPPPVGLPDPLDPLGVLV